MAKDASASSSDEYSAKDSTQFQTSTPLHTNPLTNPALPHTTTRKSYTGVLSEHGHSLARIQPMTRHSGESVATFFNGLFTTIIGIATLGASITFSYVLQPSANPPPHTHEFPLHAIQLLLGISWLLFLLDLAFASSFSTLLTFFKSHWKQDWDGVRGKTSQVAVQWYAVIASGTMGGMTIGAFICLCLVVVGYQPVVGWIALGFTSAFGILIIGSVLYQCPWAWRDVKPKTGPKKAVTV